MGTFVDLTGRRYDRLEVISRAENKGKRVAWLCRCKCGEEVVVTADNLQREHTTSCGCANDEARTRHGKNPRGNRSRIYSIWSNMLQRCNNPNAKLYENYGGRGIKLYPEWEDFTAFYDWANANGYADNLTIDRIDNDGDYAPDNCRWVTRSQNQSNRRNNVMITYNGETHTATEWSKITGIPRQTLTGRVKSGKTPGEILKR